jgi:protein phosphatase 1 regulatory subunit 16A
LTKLKQNAFCFALRYSDTGQDGLHQQQHQHQQPIYADEANGKINIHVSVVFVKSLSDLKKQRAQNRTSIVGPTPIGQQLDANGNGLGPNLASTTPGTDDFRRFTGNTSEIIGDNRNDKNCCSLM